MKPQFLPIKPTPKPASRLLKAFNYFIFTAIFGGVGALVWAPLGIVLAVVAVAVLWRNPAMHSLMWKLDRTNRSDEITWLDQDTDPAYSSLPGNVWHD